MLEPDIKIVAPIPGWRGETQLRINSGVEVAKPARWGEVAETLRQNSFAPPDPAYGPATDRPRVGMTKTRSGGTAFEAVRAVTGVYPPKADWRKLTDDELGCVYGITDGDDFASTIQIVEVPPALIELTRRSTERQRAAPVYNFDLGIMDVPAGDLGDAIAAMDTWLEQTIYRHAGWLMVNVRESAPGRRLSSGFQGLHIDLYGPPVDAQPRNRYNGSRLAINLTRDRRYVAFINLRIAKMVSRFESACRSGERRDAAAATRAFPGGQSLWAGAFMETVPDYPVVRIAIEPGQGYIAPTPIIAHEGLLEHGNEPDLILLASHKGFDGKNWVAPEYLTAWTERCTRAAHMGARDPGSGDT